MLSAIWFARIGAHSKFPKPRDFSRVVAAFAAGLLGFGLSACESPTDTLTLGVIGATVIGGQAPTHEIEQIYYLGVFDPQDQLPPQVYRVRVHGQSSFLNTTKFASGWVPAEVIDSLGTSIGFSKDSNQIEITKGNKDELSKLKTGRRLVMFGPEGFREAPANHRLVVVMGASPEKFFAAIDETLGVVAQATQDASQGAKTAELDRKLFEALTRMKNERERLDRLIEATETDLPARTGGAS